MADRFWVGGSGDWDASTTTHWASSSGGAGGQSVPTSSDNVFFDLHGNEATDAAYTVTLTATAYCLNLNVAFTGTTKVTIAGTSTIYIYGDCNLSGGSAQVIWTQSYYLRMEGAGKTLTTNGVEMPCTIRANNMTAMKLGSDITLTKNGSGYRISQTAAGKFDANGYKVTLSGGALTGSNGNWFEENLTLYDLTITGLASTTDYVDFGSYTLTVTNNLIINGNSAINRLLVKSYTLGTQRTITAANVTVTNADFQDIKGAGAASWDLSASTGGAGDCGGNTDITFTTADDWYWHAGTGNFSDYSKWYTATNGGGSQMASTRVPLPQDTCYFDASSFDSGSQTVTQNMPRIGGMVWTGATNTPALTTSTPASVFGSVTLISEMTVNVSATTYTFQSRGSVNLTTAGLSLADEVYLFAPGGTLTLQDNLTLSAGVNSTFVVRQGTFNANNKNITVKRFSADYSNVMTINMGSGTWEITSDSTPWTVNVSPNVTLNCGTSTIKLTGALTIDRPFGGGSKTYYNFWNATTGDYAIIISGSNTFNDFKINAGRKQTFTTGTTQTVTTFTTPNTGTAPILRSSTTTNATLKKAGGGTISCDYVDIDYMTGNPDVTWYMGTHSTDGGHNSQIYFTVPIITKVLTEVVKIVSPTVTNIHTFFKTLTDRLIPVGSVLRSTAKVISTPVKVISSKINTMAKTLTQIVKIDPTINVIKLLVGEYQEVIKITSSLIKSIGRTFTEIIKVSSDKLYSMDKVLIESIVLSEIYINALIGYRTLVENLKVLDERTINIGKTFTSIISIGSTCLTEFGKIYEQVISVVSSMGSFIISKVWNETVIVNWEKLTNIAKIYSESIIVHPLTLGLQASKVLIETVIGSTEWLFEKIQSVELSDNIKVAVIFAKTIIKVLEELVLMAVEQLYKSMVTVLYEVVKIAETGLFLFGHVLYEAFNVIDTMGEWVIAKLIIQVVKIQQFVGNSTSWLMVEVLNVGDSLLNVANKVLLEVLNVISTRLITIGKLLIQPLKVLDSIRFKKTQYRILSDVIYVSSEALNGAGRVFSEVLSAIGTLGSWSIGKLIINPIIVIGEYTKSWTLSRIFSETLSAVDNWIGVGAKVLSEIITVTSDLARMVPAKVFYETINVIDNIVKSLPKTFVEVIAVGGSVVYETAKIFIEVVKVVGTFVLGTISKVCNEVISIVEIYVKAWTLSRIFTQTLKVIDDELNQPGKIFSEVIKVTGTFVLGTISKLLRETVKVAYSITKTMSRIFTLVVKVGALLTKYTAGRLFTEVLQVVDPTIVKLTGRTFTEIVTVGWSKIKLVLNGIQVGLWKKVARITNGIWKKISRNDN